MTKSTKLYLGIILTLTIICLFTTLEWAYGRPALPETAEDFQQALVDAGCDIGPHGVDGDIGGGTFKGLKEYYGQ